MTRIMLGVNGSPTLLIEVTQQTDDGFDFRTINGGWDGKFTYTDVDVGIVCVNYNGRCTEGIQILCDNQDRLRGDYNDVFVNFDDTNYVAPQNYVPSTNWDDDIAF